MREGYCICCEQNVPAQGSAICGKCQADYDNAKREQWLNEPSQDWGIIHICSELCFGTGRVLTNREAEIIHNTCGRDCK